MKLPFIKSARALRGKRVLVRVDLNVPLGDNRCVDTDEDWRMRAILPTLAFLHSKGARIILMSHLGRPTRKNEADSLQPVAVYFRNVLKVPVHFVPDCVGTRVEHAIADLKNGEMLLLENLRFHKGEDSNDEQFAASLAQLGDVYVNDAFAVCHRSVASVVGITRFLPSYAGLLLMNEIEHLNRVRLTPKKPLVIVVGGAKTETKLPFIEALLEKSSQVLLGGALANTALHCFGYELGKGDCVPCGVALKKVFHSKKIVLPRDVVVGKKDGSNARVVAITRQQKQLVRRGEYAHDVGPATLRLYAAYIKKAKTIFWNGALGVFEVPAYATGTLSLARLIATHARGKAFGVIGGGETVQALRRTKMEQYVDHVSTGGGALLEYLSGAALPGLEALSHKRT